MLVFEVFKWNIIMW